MPAVIQVVDGKKQCSSCKRMLPVDMFVVNKVTPTGFSKPCKRCTEEYREKKAKRDLAAEGMWFGRLKMYPIIDGLKLCPYCNEKKSPGCFAPDPRRSSRLRTRCRDCAVKATNMQRSSLRGFLKHKLDAAKRNSTLGGRAHRQEFQEGPWVTVEQLMDLWKQQDGKCALTGEPLLHSLGTGDKLDNASIDRIDGSVGYRQDNVRLVSTAANIMRGELTDCELLKRSQRIAEYLGSRHVSCCGDTKQSGLHGSKGD